MGNSAGFDSNVSIADLITSGVGNHSLVSRSVVSNRVYTSNEHKPSIARLKHEKIPSIE